MVAAFRKPVSCFGPVCQLLPCKLRIQLGLKRIANKWLSINLTPYYYFSAHGFSILD